MIRPLSFDAAVSSASVVSQCRRLTLVHAVEYLVELLLSVFTVMLLPALSCFAPQNHQLALLPSEGSEVRDLHNDRTGGTRYAG